MLQDVSNSRWVKKAMEQRLKDQWLVTWHHNLETKSFSSSYRVFKTDFGREQYLEQLIKGDRLLVTKFRSCNNRLPVNVGRYQGVSREDRVCNMCNAEVEGEEFHVLFECTDMEIVRLGNMYIANYINRPTQFKYVLFMQSISSNVIKKLSLFLRMMLRMFR